MNNGYQNPGYNPQANAGYQAPMNNGYNPQVNPGYQVPVNNGYNPQNQGYVNPGYQNPQPQYQQGYNPNAGYQAPVNNGYGYNPQPQNQGGGIIPEDNTYSALISQRNQDLGRMQNNGMYR